jgi:hypothetical protein
MELESPDDARDVLLFNEQPAGPSLSAASKVSATTAAELQGAARVHMYLQHRALRAPMRLRSTARCQVRMRKQQQSTIRAEPSKLERRGCSPRQMMTLCRLKVCAATIASRFGMGAF